MEKTSDIKRVFDEHGLSPKKWMGQNLLVNKHYLEKIVKAADIVPGDSIVEIGAGLGVLTNRMADLGAEIWALEIDSGFFRLLQEKFAGSLKVHPIHADALKFDFGSLATSCGKLRVIANLPYNISSRLIFRFFEHSHLFSSLTILLQKEVAKRLIAKPNTKDYGILSVLLGIAAQVNLLFDIPRTAFYPIPEVTSTLVRMEFSEEFRFPVQDKATLIQLVKGAFAGRRKTLKNSFKDARIGSDLSVIETAADRMNLDLSRRGESLSVKEFGELSNIVFELKNEQR